MGNLSGQTKPHAVVADALQRARAAGQDETVVFHLRRNKTSNPPTPAETDELAEGLIKKAVSQCGHEPKCKTVFRNLGAMAVQGDPALLLKILEQPEVHEASMNQPQGGPIEPIRPVRKSAATRKGWVDVPD